MLHDLSLLIRVGREGVGGHIVYILFYGALQSVFLKFKHCILREHMYYSSMAYTAECLPSKWMHLKSLLNDNVVRL